MSKSGLFYVYLCDRRMEDKYTNPENFVYCSKEALNSFLVENIKHGMNGTEEHKKELLSLFSTDKLLPIKIDADYPISFPRLIRKDIETGNASIEFIKDLKDFFENNNVIIADNELPGCKKIQSLGNIFTIAARRGKYDKNDRLVGYKDNNIWKLSFVNSTYVYRINFNDILSDCEDIESTYFENMYIGKVDTNIDFQKILEKAVEKNVFNLIVDGSNIKTKDWHKSVPNLSIYKEAKKYDLGLELDNINYREFRNQWKLRREYELSGEKENPPDDIKNLIFFVFDKANVLCTNVGQAEFVGKKIWDLWTYELGVSINLKIELLSFRTLKEIYKLHYIGFSTVSFIPCTDHEYMMRYEKIGNNRKVLKRELTSFLKSVKFEDYYGLHDTLIDYELTDKFNINPEEFHGDIRPIISKDRLNTFYPKILYNYRVFLRRFNKTKEDDCASWEEEVEARSEFDARMSIIPKTAKKYKGYYIQAPRVERIGFSRIIDPDS